jgi:hypothetical protein
MHYSWAVSSGRADKNDSSGASEKNDLYGKMLERLEMLLYFTVRRVLHNSEVFKIEFIVFYIYLNSI